MHQAKVTVNVRNIKSQRRYIKSTGQSPGQILFRGQWHLRYLRQHRKALYTELQITGKLNGYLADLNDQTEAMFLELVKQMAVREGITEQIKSQDQMKWVQRMNNIRDRAMEVVNNDLIYA